MNTKGSRSRPSSLAMRVSALITILGLFVLFAASPPTAAQSSPPSGKDLPSVDEQFDGSANDTVPVPASENTTAEKRSAKTKESGGSESASETANAKSGRGRRLNHNEITLRRPDEEEPRETRGIPAGTVTDPTGRGPRSLPEARTSEAKPREQTANAGANAVDPIDLKVLVISADGKESDFAATQTLLRQLGIPFETMIATQAPDLTSQKLWDGAIHGYYQAVILTTGNLTYFDTIANQWQSAFSATEWQTLWDYEARFKVRQVTSYTFPYGFPDNYGLNLVSVQDTLTQPLAANLTNAGKRVFSDLNADNPITFSGAWVYLATVINAATTTPLITTSTGYAIASINTYADGRQNLAVTAANNSELMHSLLLSYGVINWVTKGLFLGERHVNSAYQIDDLYIDDDIWDPAANSDLTGLSYRNKATDISVLTNWQNAVRSNASTKDFRVEWAFNGEGASGAFSPDDLTPAVKANQSNFNFVNHTYTHRNLDAPTSAAQVNTELALNHNYSRTVPMANYSRDTLVQPDISGLTNPQFFQGALLFGIRYLISDTSQPGWNNPSPNTGFRNASFPSILIIPRRPTNLFYNLSTPAEWESEFNFYYGPGGRWAYFDHNLSYQEILDYESDWMVKYLLKWDIDPLMFHVPNVRAYDATHSLFSDLIDRTLAKYRARVNLPIRNLTQHAVGVKMSERMAFDQSGVTASLVPCTSVTVTASKPVKVPITGVAFGSAREVYGGQNISYVSLLAGQSVTIPTTVC